MTWIKTIPLSEANQKLLDAMQNQRPLYPMEYATPVFHAEAVMSGSNGQSFRKIPDS